MHDSDFAIYTQVCFDMMLKSSSFEGQTQELKDFFPQKTNDPSIELEFK